MQADVTGALHAGVPLSWAQLTGHKTDAIYKRYAIVNERRILGTGSRDWLR